MLTLIVDTSLNIFYYSELKLITTKMWNEVRASFDCNAYWLKSMRILGARFTEAIYISLRIVLTTSSEERRPSTLRAWKLQE